MWLNSFKLFVTKSPNVSFWQHFSSAEYVKTLRRCTCALSSFPWDTRPPSKIISLEIWASSLIRKNSLIVYKFHCLCTSASCSHLGIVPYFFPAPALKLLFQKKKSVLINSYIYTIHNSSSSSWQTICEQVQNYLRCQDHFSSTFSVVGHGISENPP